ncbi:uncharacterized protein LOC120658903 [Panicum virgatum]|uniref:TMV response-related protein n=1 Tax=Panicum virgatum TaxID=38727 RepID=A0A8T0VL11_PANVG|nr:uncharacterized protein LOC120658903 [Panicum virgatum]KAG2635900.1 hypothetical protein PVAP13_2NG404900 [Panicum virgatum]
MGSCVSRSTAVTSEAAAESVRALTAMVVGLDGSLAQFAAPVTAHQALAAAGAAGAAPSSPGTSFLCCSDELDFDAPVRAVGARDALQPGQLYFALPVAMLGRPLPAQDMAALAARAAAALGTATVAVATAGVPSRGRSKVGAASNKRQRWQTAGRRVAPLVDVVVSARADGGWRSDHVRGGSYGDAAKAVECGDRTVGKARWGVGHRGVARRVPRLSAIGEAASE